MFGYTMLGFGQHVQAIEASAPTSSFTDSGLIGGTPHDVTFTDTSSESPTSWAWAVTNMDGLGAYAFTTGSATSQNPVIRFTYTGSGPGPPETMFHVILTASNAVGAGIPAEAMVMVSA